MAGIYKAYDIRGIYPEELNESTFHKIGRAYAEILRSKIKKDDLTMVVGRDMRISSPQLAESLIQGITEQGVNVINIGLSSTPTFYYGVTYLKADGGMQVSASHNPKEHNGIKVVGKKALPVGYENGIGLIEQKVDSNNFTHSKRRGSVIEEPHVLKSEVEFAIRHASPEKIKSLKIVADAANAMGALYMSALFKELPCELIEMNFELDGTFPVHEADPFKEKNIKDLKDVVKKEGADLGIATDGDGDRIFFVDEKGSLVDPAILRGIMAKLVLADQPGATICYDIRPGKITRDMIEAYGGKPSVTRVGHTLIKAQAIKENAAFAGESSGHFFYNTEIGMFEMPMIVILKLLEEICASGKTMAEIVDPLRKYYHSGEINSKVDEKDEKMNEIAEIFKDGKISWLDGVSVEYDDFWFNVRPSNTESLLRLNLEAISESVLKDKVKYVLEIIRN